MDSARIDLTRVADAVPLMAMRLPTWGRLLLFLEQSVIRLHIPAILDIFLI
jgi:hypothetical protein